MSDKTSGKSIVPSGKTDLLASDTGGNRLIRRAASDALVPMNSVMNRLEPILHRVGTREFHEEDFRQLQVWASELGMEGRVADFVEAFDRFFMDFVSQSDDFAIRFTKDSRAEWCRGGRIRLFVGFGGGKLSSPRLPKLTHLSLSPGYDELDLSSVPALTHLSCHNNQLTELNLSSVSALTDLSCGGNQLTELDLSFVPALTRLSCGGNQLTALDLSSVPALTVLTCDNNQMSELDLSYVPALSMLGCSNNRLTKLDLSSMPALTMLICRNNHLRRLDLSSVPSLRTLWCYGNELSELDIRSCLNLKFVRVDPWVVVHKRPDQTITYKD